MSALRARLLLVACLTAALAGAGAWATRDTLQLDNSTQVLLAGDARGSESYQHIGHLLGNRLPLAVFVEHPALFSDAGRDALVRFATTIGSTARIEPLRLNNALRLNYGLPHGSLALKDDHLVMVQTLRLRDATPEAISAIPTARAVSWALRSNLSWK